MIKRVTDVTSALMVAIMMNNARLLDTIALAEVNGKGNAWYANAQSMIMYESAKYGFDYRIMARVIAHLSIATSWKLQERTMPIVAQCIHNAISKPDTRDIVYDTLRKCTLYDKSALFALMHYIDSICAIVDEPKKTVQFYNAIVTQTTQWYVSDSIDLQYKGLLTYSDKARQLIKHSALDNAMGSVMIYRAQLVAERAYSAHPTYLQANRWVWYHDNAEKLIRNDHPLITYTLIDCPISDTPMVQWRLR